LKPADGLIRGLGLKEATAANVVEMVGIGPFITMPLLISAMGGPQALVGWLVGALLAVCDGAVWAELGAAMPGAGGSYVYLREAFGPARMGQMMSFLFVWMTLLTAPLSAASGGVGFAEYIRYFVPTLSGGAAKLVAIAVCATVTLLAYRNIRAVGRLSFWLMLVVTGTIVWVIASGLFRVKLALLTDVPPNAFSVSTAFFWGLGQASLIAIYDYGGYNNVCYLGGEVKEPARNIPRAIVGAIALVGVLYLLMTVAIIGVVPWRQAAQSQHIVSDYMELIYGPWAGWLLTGLVVGAVFASVFALVLGASRIPYAAAADGKFFAAFARLHPRGHFPHVSLLTLGALSAFFCLLPLQQIIQVLIVFNIVLMSLPQVVAVFLIRRRDIDLPFRMWLYPLPALAAGALWIFVLVTTGWKLVGIGLGVVALGIAMYLVRARAVRDWPFASRADGGPGHVGAMRR